MYVRIYVCIYTYIHTYIRMLYVYSYIYIIHLRVVILEHVWFTVLYICIYEYIIHIYIYTYINAYVYTYMHAYNPFAGGDFGTHVWFSVLLWAPYCWITLYPPLSPPFSFYFLNINPCIQECPVTGVRQTQHEFLPLCRALLRLSNGMV
jgi:hypothetical protein